jgi:hypothetical protein
MAQTLHSSNQGKVVQLSGSYEPYRDESINELKVIFLASGGCVELHRFTNGEDGKLEQFNLDGEEMDALTEAWNAFKKS